MNEQVRGKAFANATIALNRDYYSEMYRLLNRQSKLRRFLTNVFSFSVVGFCLFVFVATRSEPILMMTVGFIVFTLTVNWWKRWRWIRDRIADLPDPPEMILSFYESTLVASTASAASEIEWDAVYKVVHEEEGVLIYPHRGVAFYFPVSCIHPVSAISRILQKVNKKVRD